MNKKRVFSGIRATGRLHLGNYLGAVKGMIELQDSNEYETIYMVVDAHSLTTPCDIGEMSHNRYEAVLDYLAAGLNPDKSIITFQSLVPEHTDLAFYLSTAISVARMLHLPTYKEKVKMHPKDVSMALLNYPVLMAADILAYKAGLVPVGIDQEPHLEVAREIARKMNSTYGTDFPEPVRFSTKGSYIPSLVGEGKMSKSVEGSYINLSDSTDEIKAKIAKMPTDSGKGNKVPDEGPIKTLFTFIDLYLGSGRKEEIQREYLSKGVSYSLIKDELSHAIFESLEDMQKRRLELSKDSKYVSSVVLEGAEKARNIAQRTVSEVKEKMKLNVF